MKKLILSVTVFCSVFLWACKKQGSEDATIPNACLSAYRVDSTKLLQSDTALIFQILNQDTVTNRAVDSVFYFDSIQVFQLEGKLITVDSIIRANTYFLPIDSTVAISNQPVYFQHCGGPSLYKAIWTGDSSHIKDTLFATPHAPLNNNLAITQSGVIFSKSVFAYLYPTSGTFKVYEICSNTGNFGQDIKRSMDSLYVKIN